MALERQQVILDWKKRHNPLIHSLMKQSLHTEDLAGLALEGQVLVKQLSNKVWLYNDATKRKNKGGG